MENKKLQRKTLAQFISSERESLGLTREGLAKAANLEVLTIDRIESGQELFLSVVERQRLARALKLEHSVIKLHEKEPSLLDTPSKEDLDNLRAIILSGKLNGNNCPACKSELVCRIAQMYDIEEQPVYHAKARCTKCPFVLRT